MRRGILAGAVVLAGCGTETVTPLPTLKVSSPAAVQGRIPAAFACPATAPLPLQWSGVPSIARALALVVTDPDAVGGTFVHWTAWNIPATARDDRQLGPALQGTNSAGTRGWTAPCPPRGQVHRYRFDVYWLPRPLRLRPTADVDSVLRAISAAAGGRGELVLRFGR